MFIYCLSCYGDYPFCAKMRNLAVGMGSSPSIRSVGPDEFRDFASNAVLAADRLSADNRPSRLRQIQSGGWALDIAEVNNHIKVDGQLDPDCLAVVFVLEGAGSAICEIPLHQNRVLILPKGERLVANARPGLSYLATTLPAALWADLCHSVLDPDGEPPGGNVEAFDLGHFGEAMRNSAVAKASHLAGTTDDGTGFAQAPHVLADHVGAIVQLCRPARSVRLDRSLRHRMRQAWQAQDFIHAHLHEDLSIMRLCKELKVSRRQLEYAFQTAFEVSPKEFIQLIRLNESRRLLMTAGKRGLSVTDVAMEVGINHLSRFSGRYRQLFGETPRATHASGRLASFAAPVD